MSDQEPALDLDELKEQGEILQRQKQRHRFVMQMLRYGHLHGGPTRAAIAAGYSEATASSQATRLLADPKIKAHLALELEKRAERSTVTPDRIIARLEQIAFGDLADLVTWENSKVSIIDSADLTPDITASIESISEKKSKGGGRELQIKQKDQLKALELLGKTLCMFRDKQADPTAQIGGVLRVPSRQSIGEWEEEQCPETNKTTLTEENAP